MLKGLSQAGGTGLLLGDVTEDRLRSLLATAKPARVLHCAEGASAEQPLVSRVSAADLSARLASLDHRLDWACVCAPQTSLQEPMNALRTLVDRLSASANVLIVTDSEGAPDLPGFAARSRSELGQGTFVHRLRRPFPNKHYVFSYWQNPGASTKRPEYLDLCAQTVDRNLDGTLEHVEVTERTVKDFLPGVREDVASLPTLAHRADYYRALLVHRYGGFWIDRDCILTTSLAQCLRDLEASNCDFIGVGRPGPRPSIGFFGGLAESCLLRRYIQAMNTTLDVSQGKGLGWTSLGYNILWPLTVTYEFPQYELARGALVAPGAPNRFFEKGEAASFKEMQQLSTCVLVFLYNAQFPVWFKKMSAADILGSDMLVSHLFRVALGK